MIQRVRRSSRPAADTSSVAELVREVARGIIRIPDLPLRWEAADVVRLFDSVYRGYPIGSLLLSRAPAPAASVRCGPLRIDAPETQEALWVVDGQQRLTALAAGLARPSPVPTSPTDEWVVYFDARERAFRSPPPGGGVPREWVPVTRLLDAAALREWASTPELSGPAELRRAVLEAGARLREYRVPLYVVETDDEGLLRDIFHRINRSGKALAWEEVHGALFGRRTEPPSTLRGLADELRKVGMGRPDEEELVSCLLASRGPDAAGSVPDPYGREPEVRKETVAPALPAIRRAISFLRTGAEIPHLRLLPRSLPMVVLTRFFARFPEPGTRTRELLTRWTWRTLLGVASSDERTVLRHAVAAIAEGGEEESVQRLLDLAPRERAGFVLPERFDARAADSRIALVAMASLRPRALDDGTEIDVRDLVEEHDAGALRRIVPDDGSPGQSPANRILLFGVGPAQEELVDVIERDGVETPVLCSHAISAHAAEALARRDTASFVALRKAALEEAVEQLGRRLAAWGWNDRPTVQYLLGQVGEAPDD
jgi:hypothetical protein